MKSLELKILTEKKDFCHDVNQIQKKAKEYTDCSKNAERDLNKLNLELEEGEKNQELIDTISKLADLLNKIETTIEGKLNDLFEKSKKLINEKKFATIENCSLSDIILNSPLIEASLLVRQVRETVKDRQRLPKLNQAIELLSASIEKIDIYLTTLCNDESILSDELSKRNGYLERFKGYFKDNPKKEEVAENEDKLYPTGAKKIDFFVLFHEVSQEKISEEEFKKFQEILPKGYLKENL